MTMLTPLWSDSAMSVSSGHAVMSSRCSSVCRLWGIMNSSSKPLKMGSVGMRIRCGNMPNIFVGSGYLGTP